MIDFQDYTGIYNDLYVEFRPQTEKEKINDDIIFEMELVKQIEVNIDYILMLVAKYHKSNCKDKQVLIAIDKAIKSSLLLRSKKELIENFISTINADTDVQRDWRKFVKEQEETDLNNLIEEEKLKAEDTRKYVENAFRDGALKTTGTDIDKILPPVSRFGGGRAKKKQTVLEKLKAFFEKYFGLGIHDSAEDEVEKVAYDAEETKLEMVAEDQESLLTSAKKNSELTSLIVETVEE